MWEWKRVSSMQKIDNAQGNKVRNRLHARKD